MEELIKKSETEMNDKEIIFSKSIKAGKRIYYIDVKKNRKEELFLAITESKKVMIGEGNETQINFEKHKIFLYKEDFEKFLNGLEQTIDFINNNQNTTENAVLSSLENQKPEETPPFEDKIRIDIDFE